VDVPVATGVSPFSLRETKKPQGSERNILAGISFLASKTAQILHQFRPLAQYEKTFIESIWFDLQMSASSITANVGSAPSARGRD
jgi:hypothetical protein